MTSIQEARSWNVSTSDWKPTPTFNVEILSVPSAALAQHVQHQLTTAGANSPHVVIRQGCGLLDWVYGLQRASLWRLNCALGSSNLSGMTDLGIAWSLSVSPTYHALFQRLIPHRIREARGGRSIGGKPKPKAGT
jgi:hypothetical protein